MNRPASEEQAFLPNEAATGTFAQAFAGRLKAGAVVFISGELGVGKTTLVRHLLKTFGVTGHIRSPSYTLIESYQTTQGLALHLDLYRLVLPEELEFIAGRELWGGSAIKFVEWPERGEGFLPLPDFRMDLELLDQGRLLTLASFDRAAKSPKEEQ